MTIEYVAWASSERGDVVLRRRSSDGALELRVNGVFVMDTVQASTERLLAQLALADATVASNELTVLVGGLGLGFTLAEVLTDERVERVIVAEIEPGLVAWHEQGLVPGSGIGDQRVEVVIGDVRDIVAEVVAGAIDVLLLDVDNGPGCLVYADNADVYGVRFLQTCRDALRQGGQLAVWSSDSAPSLREAINDVFGQCDERAIAVRLGRRDTTYHLFLASR